MTKGEVKTFYIWTTENVYVFRADGYMHGEMINSFTVNDKQLMEDISYEYEQTDKGAKNADLWTEAVQSRKGGLRGDGLLSEGRGRSDTNDRLSGNTPSSDSSRDTEREWTNPRTEEEYHEIVNKVREMLDLEPVDYSKGKFLRELDTEYLSAVNRGDMETAQRKVDEAAKEAEARAELTIKTKSAQLKAEYTTDKVFSQSSVKSGFESVPEVKKLPAKVREDIARDLWLELEASDSQDLRNEKNTHRKADLTERWVISI